MVRRTPRLPARLRVRARSTWGRTRPASSWRTSRAIASRRSSGCFGSRGSATGSTPLTAASRTRGWSACTPSSTATRRQARELGAQRVLATATSAVRDAANGGEFLAVGRAPARVRDPPPLRPRRGRAHLPRRHIPARGPPRHARVRHRRRLDGADPGRPGRRRRRRQPRHRLRADVGAVPALRPTRRRRDRGAPCSPPAGLLPADLVAQAAMLVGVAGTVTTLATIDLGLDREIPEQIDGHPLAAATVESLLGQLAAVPLAERRGVRGLMPERAPTIVAGAAIAAEVLKATGAGQMVVSAARHPARRGPGCGRACLADNASSPGGGAGRHGGLKIPFPYWGSASSSLAPGTGTRATGRRRVPVASLSHGAQPRGLRDADDETGPPTAVHRPSPRWRPFLRSWWLATGGRCGSPGRSRRRNRRAWPGSRRLRRPRRSSRSRSPWPAVRSL